MSAGKLDQSLDQIMKDSGSTGRRPGRRNARRVAKTKATAAVAPTGGVKKNKKDDKAKTVAPTVKPTKVGDSKILVSGLPEDVNETQIKDYFGKTIGPVKRVSVSYGPNGRSRGRAEIVFSKGDAAAKAAKDLNGVKVDGRAMRIEVIMGASNVITAAGPKSLSERVSQPKSAAKDKPKVKGEVKKATTAVKAREPKKKSGRAGRAKPKSAEELDQEMQDYFGGEANGTTNGTAVNGEAAPATNGGGAEEDVVM
ncbi:hypothetical protein K431DRAFT_301405 [Polychaeton citri CBS 116435]|uniref:RRM domain-containing protein n=1 Tax=Polychaeton citri CBS 116435 TaxID=1314669 RepID=A0A9P4QB18_9PEZI|nr:hypothetical protein K431DRAFT_301405 [Polychaeton citri CBS 116435]